MNKKFYVDKINRNLKEHTSYHYNDVIKALKLDAMDLDALKAISFLTTVIDIYAKNAKVIEQSTEEKVMQIWRG